MIVGPYKTVAELNQRHREFWAQQAVLFDKRMANKAIRTAALAMIKEEELRISRFEERKSLQWALEFVAHAVRGGLEDSETVREYVVEAVVQKCQIVAGKGGKAPKADALQKLIEEAVEADIDISWKALLRIFDKNKNSQRIITDVDEKFVCYYSKGREKKAPISGLKDRLTRARNKIRAKLG